ncbi:MAG: archaemetzincin family Zn-dependent metalloprotease [Bryobacteraceae bacterium]
MKAIHVQPVGAGVRLSELDGLAAGLAGVLGVSCHVRDESISAQFAFDPSRNQFHSTLILESLARSARDARVLGITAADLFVPILTFVFGEAQLGGSAALVSTHRLQERFYGLPAREDLERERLLKEAVHELGHTYGLRHCHDWRCVMASSNDVGRIDLKEPEFCARCRGALLS